MSKRLEYIDAIKGFLIVLVVMNHIEVFCFGNRVPSFGWYFLTFLMPLFFFISGFLAYKKGTDWNFTKLLSDLKKKFVTLIIPTIIFYAIFLHFFPTNEWLTDGAKKGYWFTYVLFEYFFFYSTTCFIFNKKQEYRNIALGVVAIGLYSLSTESVSNLLSNYHDIYGILSIQHWCFFPFFVLGSLVKQYQEQYDKAFANKYISALLVILFFIFMIFFSDIVTMNKSLHFFISGITGVLIIYFIFKNANTIIKGSKTGKVLQFLGKRTLDIYLIHYIFLPRHLVMIGDFFKTNDNRTFEFFAALFFVIMVILICLTISHIIRLSPLTAQLCFGVKPKKDKQV